MPLFFHPIYHDLFTSAMHVVGDLCHQHTPHQVQPMVSNNEAATLSEKELRFDHLVSLWRKGNISYKSRLSQSFAQVLRHNVSAEYLVDWTTEIQKFFVSVHDERHQGTFTNSLYYPFIRELLDSGMITTLLRIASFTDHKDASYSSLSVITFLIVLFKADMRHCEEIFTNIVNHGGIEILSQIISHGSARNSATAVCCLHRLLLRSPGNDILTASQVATVISACSEYHLDGLMLAISELINHETSHIIEAVFYTEESPVSPMDQLMNWFKTIQHDALDACSAILRRRTTPISRQFSLEVLQSQPYISKNLLKIACEGRLEEDFEKETDGLAAEVLLRLVLLPQEVVAGHEVMFKRLSDENKAEWGAALLCNQLLYSCHNATEMVVRMRQKVLEEDVAKISRKIATSTTLRQTVDELNQKLCKNRATLLIVSLRILINFTYLDSISGLFFLAILPFSYSACVRIPTTKELAARKEESEYELSLTATSEDPLTVALMSLVGPELLLGPMLLFRVLHRLSDAGYGLEALQKLDVLPPGMPIIRTSPVYLAHVHQIVEPRIVGKLIRLGVDRRIQEQRNRGKELLVDEPPTPNWIFATATYLSAAELALAINAFGSHPCNHSTPTLQENQNWIRRAKQQVVLCLGNAAEAARKSAQWEMVKTFARNAIDFSDVIPMEDAKAIMWDIVSARGKNERRLIAASMETQGGVRHSFGIFKYDDEAIRRFS